MTELLKTMILDYKNNGSRVDEVLFQEVNRNIEQLKEFTSGDVVAVSVAEMIVSLKIQNSRYRKALEKAKAELEEDINIIDCARNAHYTLSEALEDEK